MKVNGMAVLAVVAFGAVAHADEASLQLTFQPKGTSDKTVFVARSAASDGTVRAEAKLEVTVARHDGGERRVTLRAQAAGSEVQVQARAERSGSGRRERAERSARGHGRMESREAHDDVAKALAEAASAMKEADQAMKQARRDVEQAEREVEQAEREVEQARREVEAARRELRAGLESVGFRFEGERTLGREPRTVCELAGIDAKLVVSKSATRREATVEVGGRTLACTLHTFDVKDGGETKSVAVWVSADAKGTGLVALRVASKDGAHEVALEGTKGSLRVLLEERTAKAAK